MTNITDIIEVCRSHPDELWSLLLVSLADELHLPPRREYASLTATFLATLHIQRKTASNAGIEKWGFTELMNRLGALPDKHVLHIEEFDTKAHLVRCVLNSNDSVLLGCTIVKKRLNPMQTPDWDGSIDSLNEFNNSRNK